MGVEDLRRYLDALDAREQRPRGDLKRYLDAVEARETPGKALGLLEMALPEPEPGRPLSFLDKVKNVPAGVAALALKAKQAFDRAALDPTPTYGQQLAEGMPAGLKNVPLTTGPAGALDLVAKLARGMSGVGAGAAELGPERAKPLTEVLVNLAMGTPRGGGGARRPSLTTRAPATPDVPPASPPDLPTWFDPTRRPPPGVRPARRTDAKRLEDARAVDAEARPAEPDLPPEPAPSPAPSPPAPSPEPPPAWFDPSRRPPPPPRPGAGWQPPAPSGRPSADPGVFGIEMDKGGGPLPRPPAAPTPNPEVALRDYAAPGGTKVTLQIGDETVTLVKSGRNEWRGQIGGFNRKLTGESALNWAARGGPPP